jgi:hypothetical protein
MIEEQQRFLLFFTLSVVTTVWGLCGDFFIMMELPGSWAGSAVLFAGLIYSVSSCVRIYNRFYFKNDIDSIKGISQVGQFNREYMGSFDAGRESVINPQHAGARSSIDPHSGSRRSPFVDYEDDPTIESSLRFEYSSYITMKTGTSWSKFYFVIKGRYGLYYKDRTAFEYSPIEPINRRPIVLDEYVVDVGVDKVSNTFLLNLIPAEAEDIRKTWEFRIDTENELQTWRTEFENVCAKSKSL